MDVTAAAPMRIAREIARRLADHPAIVAVAMGGSRGSLGLGPDARSDLDLEVYTRGEVPLEARRAIVVATGAAARVELGGTSWGFADEWVTSSGLHVDLAYFDASWMADRIAALLDRHEPSLGSTGRPAARRGLHGGRPAVAPRVRSPHGGRHVLGGSVSMNAMHRSSHASSAASSAMTSGGRQA